ncbi:MAG: AmmeMemoRadiSam system protein A [Salinivirgaceae bacterium]|nr:AmmeMemoRadiSam system protein A [Salinivirgaceae bacterium]MDD4747075.1 AmmeMemoRadiSam system protein A [Salinivirgaceae bacterium]
MNCKTTIATYAAEVIEQWTKLKKRPELLSIPPEMQIKAACFVSVHTIDGNLRGCIGTLEPSRNNLALEITENAIAASERDPRFDPIEAKELQNLTVSVDVLSEPEPTTIAELDPKTYGLIISDGCCRRGVLLPNLEGIKSIEDQIRIVKRKAGLELIENNKLQFFRFTATRYE